MKKILTIAFLLLLSLSVWADGMVVDPDFLPLHQQNQQAFIHYENGTENLFIFVNLQQSVAAGKKSVWIFPVPAKPEDIKIDNLKGFPNLGGKEIKQQLSENFYFLEGYLALAAFPPAALIAIPIWLTQPVYSTDGMREMTANSSGIPLQGLTVFEHIDKFGIATEVIKADDVSRFKSYLQARGSNLSPDAEQFLSEYMGKDYSFIVSWVSGVGLEDAIGSGSGIPNAPGASNGNTDSVGTYPSSGQYSSQSSGQYPYPYYNSNPIGVFIRFPSNPIFYPLKPTAYYGTDYLPVTINISGFKTPEIFPNIREKTTVRQYDTKFLSHTIQEEETLKAVFNGKIPESLQYTRITINTQANYFTQDLWIPTGEAISSHAINFVNQTWLFWLAVLFFLVCFIAAILANRLVLQNSLKPLELAGIALSNFLTAIAAGLVLAVMKKEKFGIHQNSGTTKKFVFLLVFEGLVLAIAILLFVLTLLAFSGLH